MTSKNELIKHLSTYSTKFGDEEPFVSKFLDLLNFRRCFYRDHLPGHITGSAWIVDETKSHVLLIHHAKLNRWLQPGGHADGDENIFRVSLREAEEETGLKKLKPFTEGVFDLDVHPIPARNDFPEHLHYDVRFAFIASGKEELQLSHESHDLQWIKISQVPEYTQHNRSIIRMIEKTISS